MEITYEMYRLQLLNSILLQYNVILNAYSVIENKKIKNLDSIDCEEIDITCLWSDYRSLAFVLTHRMYPFFENIDKDIFRSFSNSVYDIPYLELLNIYKYLDNKESIYIQLDNHEPPLTYYRIERELGGEGNRFTIIRALHYAKMAKRFLWVFENLNFENEAPIEALFLMNNDESDFKISDVSFL